MTTRSQTIQAMAISPGIAQGRVLHVAPRSRTSATPQRRVIGAQETASELERLNAAIEKTKNQLRDLRGKLEKKLEAADAGIFEAQLLLADDRTFRRDVEKRIGESLVSAEYALYESTEHFVSVFSGMPDEYLQERAADLRDVSARIMDNLSASGSEATRLDDRRIIVARTLTPSETAQLDPGKVLGFVIETGSPTSHTAILARSMRLPAVAGVPAEVIDNLAADDRLVIDGYLGRVIINPDTRTSEAYQLKAREAGRLLHTLEQENALRSESTDGFAVTLAANVDSTAQLDEIKRAGAGGIGLFRTEFLFLGNDALPDEESQFALYKKLLIEMGELPVTVRTLDIGGDKLSSGIYRSSEANPFLGLRGIRLCLQERQDLFRTQLRALLRAGVYGNLQIMLPMVSSTDEVAGVRAIIAELQEELKREGREFQSHPALGVMIETPAAALMADQFAAISDFFSIGTNDLVQYTMAIDRTNERVAYLYQPAHPAILRAIRNCVLAGRKAGIPVAVCGQMAADPQFTALLFGLGINELSMPAASLPVVRRVVRSISFSEAEELARRALECSGAAETLELAGDLLRRRAPEIMNI